MKATGVLRANLSSLVAQCLLIVPAKRRYRKLPLSLCDALVFRNYDSWR